jgi:8-oxo-dGTP pyrophosphatase MutT (NUDIX family)
MTSEASHYSTASALKGKKAPMEPRPSSSIVLLSPTNQVLLLHRVKTSSSFASAHVFPGGNLSEFHDGTVPPPGDLARHQDSRPYRLGAIRETFEESGILLARDVRGGKGNSEGLLSLPAAERDAARKMIYANEIQFEEWLKSVGGEVDLGMPIITCKGDDLVLGSILSLGGLTRNCRQLAPVYSLDNTSSHAEAVYYADVSIYAALFRFELDISQII